LIRRKNTKIVATRCQFLRPKCTKVDFGPDPAGGAYSAPPDLYLRGPTFKGREGRERGRLGKGEGKGRGGRGRGTPAPPPNAESWLRHCLGPIHYWKLLESELHFRNIRVPAMNWTCVPDVAE